MKRSSSWPQSNILEDDVNFLYPEVEIGTLQHWVSDVEIQNTSSSELETVNLEKANLEILNMKLIEDSISSSQKILDLENEKKRLKVWLEEAENLVEVLQEDLEKANREKRAISKDLCMQQKAFEIAVNSKKCVEKQMEMFREVTVRDRNEIQSKALEELGSLTNHLQALEYELKAKEEATQQVEILTTENKKLHFNNRELIKQNAVLDRQLNELQERFELQKEQNQQLRQKAEDTKVQNTCSISVNAVPYEPPSIKIFSPIPSRASTLSSQRDEITPPPLIFLHDWADETSVSCRDFEIEQRQHPLDEYIRLSVKAVKICFPNVRVSCDRLIEKAKMVPFYKVHDVLSSYMRKLEYMQSVHKIRVKKQSLFDIQSPSILEKVRGLFGCGVMLEYSQDYRCNEMRLDWGRKAKTTGIRVGF